MLLCCHKYLPLIAERWHDVFLRLVIHIIIIIIINIIIIIIIISRITLSLDPVSSSVYCWIHISPPFGLNAQYKFWQNCLFHSQYMTPDSNNIMLYEITLNLRISMFHRAFFNSIIDKHQHMHFFTFKTVLV